MMRFHHVGLVVTDIARHAAEYATALGFRRCSRPAEVSSQRVRVAFVEVGPGSFIELVEPLPGETWLDRYLAGGYYHVCYLVDDMDEAIARARASFILVNRFDSEAFGGRPCAFLINPQGHLVELAETSTEDFQALFDASVAID